MEIKTICISNHNKYERHIYMKKISFLAMIVLLSYHVIYGQISTLEKAKTRGHQDEK
jgi:hypothetical protein